MWLLRVGPSLCLEHYELLVNMKQIEEKMLEIPFGMKALLSLQKKERYTMEDWYQIYENKMEKIYS